MKRESKRVEVKGEDEVDKDGMQTMDGKREI